MPAHHPAHSPRRLPAWMPRNSTEEAAKLFLAWFKRQPSWLLVVDNLDDFNIMNGLLPENGERKHTLITTRNPNAEYIPAQDLCRS
jgi:hypothetical protein